MKIHDKNFFLTSDLVRRIIKDGELFISVADFYAYTDILVSDEQSVVLPFEWGREIIQLPCINYKDFEHII